MTAASTLSPRYASASVFSFCRIIALISGGEYSLPPASTRASPFGPLTTLNGTIVSSSFTSACLRPMKRLIEKTVFSGLVTACRLATVPTRRSPPWVNATTEGVVRAPSAFSMTVGSPPSRIAMHELVVPRSIPIVFAICRGPPSKKSKPDCGRCFRGRQPDRESRKQRSGKQGPASDPAFLPSAFRLLSERAGAVRRPEPGRPVVAADGVAQIAAAARAVRAGGHVEQRGGVAIRVRRVGHAGRVACQCVDAGHDRR